MTTHDHTEVIPILENNQDCAMLSDDLSRTLANHPAAHGILLRRHGLYTWGASIAEARRYVDVLEFLFEVAVRLQESRSGIRHRQKESEGGPYSLFRIESWYCTIPARLQYT